MLTTETISHIQWNEACPEDVNANYRVLQQELSPSDLSALQLSRSLWVKEFVRNKVREASHALTETAFLSSLDAIRSVSGHVTESQVNCLLASYERVGNADAAEALAMLLADFADSTKFRGQLNTLDPSRKAMLRCGPAVDLTIKPMRRSRSSSSANWLHDPKMSQVEFIDGNPDHIRVRGIELKSGDIGVVQLNKFGDGILEGFLSEPAIASHAFLYVTRRIQGPNGKTLYQPAVVEIYEGGWRSIPITTVLHSEFSWYSEWVRPANLPENVGELLSAQLSKLGNLAFDFQGRKAPANGDFSSWEQPCATCTNFIRIPFEMAGISLPYPTTPVHPGAVKNLIRLGVGDIQSIYTPTNILTKSGATHVGIVDNGVPEYALAQSMVIGRPDLPYTFGGVLCQSDLQVERLPDWRSISKWRSAWANLLVNLGQTENSIGKLARFVTAIDRSTVPLSAPAATISFYLRCEFEAKYIICNSVLPLVRKMVRQGIPSCYVEHLHQDPEIHDVIRTQFLNTALVKEGWFPVR